MRAASSSPSKTNASIMSSSKGSSWSTVKACWYSSWSACSVRRVESYVLSLVGFFPTVTSWKNPAPSILTALFTFSMVRRPSALFSLSRIILFLSSAPRFAPRSTMYACSSSSFICLLISSCQSTSLLARYESFDSSDFCWQRNNAFSAASYFFSRAICPHFPPKISMILWMDFLSLAVIWSAWSCNFCRSLAA